MADFRISDLPEATAALGTQQHEVNDGGVSKRLTNAQLATYIAAEIPTATETVEGVVEKATTAEAEAGTANKFPDAAGVLSSIGANAVEKTSSTGSAVIPAGTEAQRDGSPVNGYFRYNSDAGQFEGYASGAWGAVGGGGTPVGSVFAFANAVPSDFLECDGSAISRTTYANLFDYLGATYGAGDGSTTFNLPDLRGEFIRGFDAGRGVDTGRVLGSSQLDQMQRITGSASRTSAGGFFQRNFGYAAGAFNIGAGTSATIAAAGSLGNRLDFDSGSSPNARVSSTTSGETRPRNIAMRYGIKY